MPYQSLKLVLTGLIITCWFNLYGQTIAGKVYKAGTDSVIAQASVYYGGTQTGTITDAEGLFKIQQISGKIPMVVSCIGYYSTILNDYSSAAQLKVYLKPKVNELQDITISAGGMLRADMEKLFIREFIGVSDNATSCRIINLNDVDLYYSKKTRTLTAFSDKPLEIENKRLGYHITYYLDKFVKDPKNTLYQGNYVFTDKMTEADKSRIKRNRENAYTGSRMEFIRALWSDKLDQYGYKVLDHYSKPVPIDSFLVSDKLSQKFVILPERVSLVNNGNPFLITRLASTEPRSFIDRNGFYGTGLKWYGYMGQQRIGDLLPFEYQSAKEIKAQQRL